MKKLIVLLVYLENDIYNNNQDRVSKVEEKPDLHILYGNSSWETSGDRKVHGWQNHHAGHVHLDDVSFKFGIFKETCDCVDDVYEDCW